ncbi:YbbR-like domain-containing protein [Adhaeribacter soli]|uniref:YbbR-like domain-containing protein n=1 Tax=Adhaeribacter soli TaxID=2607655 RepID=A0A5N1IUT0_9BACT|nr:hypothetical protein [Adhaeribacter soli]KAA9331810.1 hypothetical protein F0P94_13485 [Adhaeribacter soli]
MLCFLVASTFWVLNSLNKTYYNVRTGYPIVFIYDPQKLVPVTEPPKEVVINVTAKGWKLLGKALNLKVQPARIVLPAKPTQNYLTSRQLRTYINSTFQGVELNYVVTDTIYFHFEELIKRRIRLAVDTTNSPVADGYFVSGKPRIIPAAVTVSGPASLVKALSDPYPLHLPDSGLTESYQKSVPLAFVPQELVGSQVKKVNVRLQVKPLRQAETRVAVQFINQSHLPNGAQLQPDSVQVKYYFADTGHTHPDSQAFKAEADLKKLDPRDSSVSVKITRKPRQVKRVAVSPEKVRLTYPAP